MINDSASTIETVTDKDSYAWNTVVIIEDTKYSYHFFFFAHPSCWGMNTGPIVRCNPIATFLIVDCLDWLSVRVSS